MSPPQDDFESTVATSPEIVTVHHVSGVWRLRAVWRGRLLAAGAPDWFRLQDDRRATLVKQGRGRSVWRVDLGEDVVFAKVVQLGSRLQRVKALVLGDPARREWDALEACTARNVPVPEAIGWGSQPGNCTSVLITRAIEPAQTFLDSWMAATKSVRDRRARTIPLIRAAATLFATAHERGVWHRDAHAGNILVRAVDAECSAYFTDLLGAKVRRGALDWKASMQSLAQFDQRMRCVATRVERLRFLKEYMSLRHSTGGPASIDLRTLMLEKDRAQCQHAAQLARLWDRRLRGDGKYFGRVQLADGWRGVVVLRIERPHVHGGVVLPNWSVAHGRMTLREFTQSNSIDECLVQRAIKITRQSASGFGECLQWTVCGSSARREFLKAYQRLHRDQTAPPLLGYLERRRFGFIDECLVLNEVGPL